MDFSNSFDRLYSLNIPIGKWCACKTLCHAVLPEQNPPVVNSKWRETLCRFHALRVFCNYLSILIYNIKYSNLINKSLSDVYFLNNV